MTRTRPLNSFPASTRYFVYDDMLGIDPEPTEVKTIRIYGVRRPNTLKEVTYTAATIGFTNNASAADTLDDSANGLATLNLQPFDRILVSGDPVNDGEYTISTIVAGALAFHKKETVTTQAEGASVTLTPASSICREHRYMLALGAAARIAELYDLNDAEGKSRAPSLNRNFAGAFSRFINDVDVDEGVYVSPHRSI